jgi:pimeloyl-ACP methyl ester carboxylesterase
VPTAEIAGNTLYWERRGAGEPLVLVMGMSGHSAHWDRPFAELLERDFELLIFDNRGIGQSSPVAADFTIADMAADTVGVMEAAGFERAHVMGISMGGMIAQQLAVDHPQRVRGLVLGCTYPGGPGAAVAGPEIVQRLAGPLMSGDREAAIRAGWEVNVSPAFAAQDEHWRRFREVAGQHPASLEAIMRQMGAISRHDLSARLGSIESPALVIHGSEDEMLPVRNAELIAEKIPGARLEILEGVGHLFFWEQPERSAQLVREFLAEVGAADPAAAQ